MSVDYRTVQRTLEAGGYQSLLALPSVRGTLYLTGNRPELHVQDSATKMPGQPWAQNLQRVRALKIPSWMEDVVRRPLAFDPNEFEKDIFLRRYLTDDKCAEAFRAKWQRARDEIDAMDNEDLRTLFGKEMLNAMVLVGTPTLHTGFVSFPIENNNPSKLSYEVFRDRELITTLARWLKSSGFKRKQTLSLQRTTSPGLVFACRRATPFWKFVRNLLGALTIARDKVSLAWYHHVLNVMNSICMSHGCDPIIDTMLQGARHQARRKPSPIMSPNKVRIEDVRPLTWEKYIQGKNRAIQMLQIFGKTLQKYLAGVTETLVRDTEICCTTPDRRDAAIKEITQYDLENHVRFENGDCPLASDLESYDLNQSFLMYEFFWSVMAEAEDGVRTREGLLTVARTMVVFACTWGSAAGIYALNQAGGYETSGNDMVTSKNCIGHVGARAASVKYALSVYGEKVSYDAIISCFEHGDSLSHKLCSPRTREKILGDDHAEMWTADLKLIRLADDFMGQLGLRRGYERCVTFLKLQAYLVPVGINFMTHRRAEVGPNVGSWNKNFFSERPRRDEAVLVAGATTKVAGMPVDALPASVELWDEVLSTTYAKKASMLAEVWPETQARLREYAQSAAGIGSDITELYNTLAYRDGMSDDELEELFGPIMFDPEESANEYAIGDLSKYQLLALCAGIQNYLFETQGECPSEEMFAAHVARVRGDVEKYVSELPCDSTYFFEELPLRAELERRDSYNLFPSPDKVYDYKIKDDETN